MTQKKKKSYRTRLHGKWKNSINWPRVHSYNAKTVRGISCKSVFVLWATWMPSMKRGRRILMFSAILQSPTQSILRPVVVDRRSIIIVCLWFKKILGLRNIHPNRLAWFPKVSSFPFFWWEIKITITRLNSQHIYFS